MLLAVGWACAAVAGSLAGAATVQPAVVAGLLVASILLYAAWLKRTWAGPLGMGACRFLNVLLGFSPVAGGIACGLFPALVVCVYIVGVTWFARTEARHSNQVALAGAAVVMLL